MIIRRIAQPIGPDMIKKKKIVLILLSLVAPKILNTNKHMMNHAPIASTDRNANCNIMS